MYVSVPVLPTASRRVDNDAVVSCFTAAVSMPDLPGARGSLVLTKHIHASSGKSRSEGPAPWS